MSFFMLGHWSVVSRRWRLKLCDVVLFVCVAWRYQRKWHIRWLPSRLHLVSGALCEWMNVCISQRASSGSWMIQMISEQHLTSLALEFGDVHRSNVVNTLFPCYRSLSSWNCPANLEIDWLLVMIRWLTMYLWRFCHFEEFAEQIFVTYVSQ